VAAGALVLTGCVIGETGDPEIIANSSVTLTGTVHWPDDAGVFADVWFEYGTTDAYGQSTQRKAVQEHSPGETPVSTRISDLVPETTYHYRLCSSDHKDGYGTCGVDQIVTTSGDRDSVYGEGGYPLDFGGSRYAQVVASGGPGYLEGTGFVHGVDVLPPRDLRLEWGGTGPIGCLRVEGNNAVVGFTFHDPVFGEMRQLVYIQDNGATGDRFGLAVWYSGCPAPDPSLATNAGSFVVEDG